MRRVSVIMRVTPCGGRLVGVGNVVDQDSKTRWHFRINSGSLASTMKNKRIEFVASAEDLERFRATSVARGLSLSAWLRMVALEAARQRPNGPFDQFNPTSTEGA